MGESLPFQLRKIGHVVLNVSDLDGCARFYQDVLGLEVSDVYKDDLRPGGVVFMRVNADHHGIALFGGAPRLDKSALNHFALEVATPDEVFRARAWLRKHGVPIDFEGRRRAGCQLAIEFRDPEGNNVEIYWGIDQIGSDGHVRPASEWKPAKTLEEAVANPVVHQRVPPITAME